MGPQEAGEPRCQLPALPGGPEARAGRSRPCCWCAGTEMGSTRGCPGAGSVEAQAGAAPRLPGLAALQRPGLSGSPAPVQSWAPHRLVSSAPPYSWTRSRSSNCSGAWKKSSWPMPEPLRLLLAGIPPDQPLTQLGPQTLQLLTRPTVPPVPPLHPSVSWVASVANPGTLAEWPMGCPGPEAQSCPALPMKAAPAPVWGAHQMHLGAPWLAWSSRGPGHGAGWTHSQTENPHASPRLGALAALLLDPQSLGPGMPCTL